MPLNVFCDPLIWPYFKFISAAFSSSTNSAITNDDFRLIASEAVGLLQEMAHAGSGGVPEVKLCIERHAARFTVCHSATVSSFFFLTRSLGIGRDDWNNSADGWGGRGLQS